MLRSSLTSVGEDSPVFFQILGFHVYNLIFNWEMKLNFNFQLYQTVSLEVCRQQTSSPTYIHCKSLEMMCSVQGEDHLYNCIKRGHLNYVPLIGTA